MLERTFDKFISISESNNAVSGAESPFSEGRRVSGGGAPNTAAIL